MSINMAAEGNVNVKNLVQTIVQDLAFRQTIDSILTATNQEQLTFIVLIVSAEIPDREGSIYPSSFYRQLSIYCHKCQPYLPRRWFLLFVPGVSEQDTNKILFLVLIKGMEGGEVSSRFSCITLGVWEFSLSFIASEVAEFSACGVFVDD